MEGEETKKNVEIEVCSNEEECVDDLTDSQVNEYKELSYKLFQFRTYRLRSSSNGAFGCPFCDYKEDHENRYIHLLLHAIRVGEEGSGSRKQISNHFAMAKYLAVDLAHEVKAEADRISRSEEGKKSLKRPRLDGDTSKGKKEAADMVLHLQRELNEKANTMNGLITKERQSNDELQGARRVLIKGLNDIVRGNYVKIGIKNVGEIDSKVFISEMEKRFSPEIAARKGAELCSLWQENLKNPQWHPYTILVDDIGIPQRLLKEDDALLRGLKKEWGQEIHDAVVEALNELQDYNPSGGYGVRELWNFEENRRAKLDEVISCILEAAKETSLMNTDQKDTQHKKNIQDEETRKEAAFNKLLKEKGDLERSYHNLLAREEKSFRELRGARKELIKILNIWQSEKCSEIGIKQMGEIDLNVIKRVCSNMKRFQESEAEAEAEAAAVALYSMWQENLKDQQWRPVQMVVDNYGNLQIMVDDDDSLRHLKQIWGHEIYNAVVRALEDLFKYCPTRDCSVAELWNFKENRKAKLEEVIRDVTATRGSLLDCDGNQVTKVYVREIQKNVNYEEPSSVPVYGCERGGAGRGWVLLSHLHTRGKIGIPTVNLSSTIHNLDNEAQFRW